MKTLFLFHTISPLLDFCQILIFIKCFRFNSNFFRIKKGTLQLDCDACNNEIINTLEVTSSFFFTRTFIKKGSI